MQKLAFDFKNAVIDNSHKTPVVVDFWAEWCGPCRVLGPILEKLASEANGAWELVKVNTDEQPQLSTEYGIRSIPAVKMFYGGEVIAEFVGALPEIQVRNWLEKSIPSESKKLVAEAQKSLRDGEDSNARQILEKVVRKDGDNYEARILLAKLIFADEPTRAAELVNNTPEESALYQEAESIKALTRLLNWDMNSPDATESQAWQSYLNGIAAFKSKDYDKALEHWIESITLDKSIDDEGARKACIALFGWLGQNHEVTQKYHRSFTSALF